MSRTDEIFGLFYLGCMHNTYLSLLKKTESDVRKKVERELLLFSLALTVSTSHQTKGGLVVQAVQEEAQGSGAR